MFFDQQMHACACICMFKNDQKHLKIIKKLPFSSCIPEAHVRLTKKNEEKSLSVNFFLCFSWFFFVSLLCAFRVHDEKGTLFIIFECCVCWSKYTTNKFNNTKRCLKRLNTIIGHFYHAFLLNSFKVFHEF